MAIQFTDFSKIAPQESPLSNMFENVLKGYKIAKEPGKMKQEEEQRALANSLQKLALEHKPKEYANADALAQAQIHKANQPAALKGALAQAFQFRNSLDPKSPTYENDLGRVNNYIDKLGTSSRGVQISGTPGGEFQISVGGQGDTATIPGLPKLKTGETYLYDDNKQPIGIGKPYTEGEKKEESGRAAFNQWQKFITESQAPYSGKGATKQFENDVAKYSTDPEAKQRIDNLLASEKLLFSTTVKEEATLGGANTNQAYNRITHSLENSEIFPLLKKIAKYQLPQGYSQFSSDIYNQQLNEGTEAGKNIPAYKPYYFKANKPKTSVTAPSNAALSSALNKGKKSNPVVIGTKDGFTTIRNGEKTLRIPENLVDQYMIEHSQPEFGGNYGR